jgi:ABC-type glycerol-3-phosphate transport system substrate-binding protein
MKRFFRLALILALALALTLFAGCSGKSNAPEGTDPPGVTAAGSAETLGQLAFAAKRFSLPEGFEPTMTAAGENAVVTDDRLFFADDNKLYAAAAGDFIPYEVSVYAPLEGYELVMLGEAFGGGLLALESGEGRLVVSRLDVSGVIEGVTDITDAVSLYGGNEILKLVTDADDYLYIITAVPNSSFDEVEVIIIAPDGKAVKVQPEGGLKILNAVVSGGGKVYTARTMGAEQDFTLYELRSDGGFGTQTGSSLSQYTRVYGGGGGYDLLYCDYFSLYALDTASGASTELFNVLDEYGIYAVYFGNLWCASDYGIVAYADGYLHAFERGEPDTRTVLRIAAYAPFLLNFFVGEFNNWSDNYRIIVEDYLRYDAEAYDGSGKLRLNTEVLAGNIPDMIDFSLFDAEPLESKGYLADLYPLMDADPDFDRSDLYESCLNDFERGGALYQAPMAFDFVCFLGKSEVVGTEVGWTLDEALALEERYTPDAPGFGGMTRKNALRYYLGASADSFIDWETGKCSFDSEEFIQILEYLRSLKDVENDPGLSTLSAAELLNDELIMYPVRISSLYYLMTFDEVFGNTPYTIKGFPSRAGESGLIKMYGNSLPIVGITSGGENIEGAWSFIKFIYTEYDSYKFGMQVSKSAQAAMLAEDMGDGELALERLEYSAETIGSATLKVDLTGVALDPPTTEQAERLDALIAAADTALLTSGGTVMNIINEELPAFFAGDKSSADTAKIIQSRVQIYVSEQM